jgi:hypothetical protein
MLLKYGIGAEYTGISDMGAGRLDEWQGND